MWLKATLALSACVTGLTSDFQSKQVKQDPGAVRFANVFDNGIWWEPLLKGILLDAGKCILELIYSKSLHISDFTLGSRGHCGIHAGMWDTMKE